jgi:hypothetical protein
MRLLIDDSTLPSTTCDETLLEAPRVCKECGREIDTSLRNKKALYCNSRCKTKHLQKKAGIKGSGLASGTTSAINKLVVSADLLRRGYEVLRPVSPSSSCDLAILRDGKLSRVEVRAGYRNRMTGTISTNRKGASQQDIFAIVIGTEIIYEPPLP